MLVGAAIAVAVRQPLLIVPLTLLSHFVMDMLPHFGVLQSDTPERNNHAVFRLMVVIDTLLCIGLLVALPIFFHEAVTWWIVLLGMLAAWIPDTVWISHFIDDQLNKPRSEPLWLTKFHQKIQWFEKPVGIVTELAFGVVAGISIWSFTT